MIKYAVWIITITITIITIMSSKLKNQLHDTLIVKLEQYYQDVKNFKHFFISNCQVEKKYEAYNVWSHWLIRNLCETSDNFHMIPTQSIVNDTDILQHLQEKGVSTTDSIVFYTQVINQVTELYQKYHQFRTQLIHNEALITEISQRLLIKSVFDEFGENHVFQLGSNYIKHNHLKYQTLITSYVGKPEHRNFYLFELGFNYYILDGPSLQWCVPPKVFTILHQQLNVNTELFASPMNRVSPMYCSLFYIDRQFGALDNFFNLDTQQTLEGSFEINPPFIDNLFIRSSKMVIDFLKQSQSQSLDLLFIYIMPDWLDSKGYQLLANSQYLIEEIVFNKNKHCYYQSSNQRMVTANFESHMLIIGTTQAKLRWTSKIKQEIIKNFSNYERK